MKGWSRWHSALHFTPLQIHPSWLWTNALRLWSDDQQAESRQNKSADGWEGWGLKGVDPFVLNGVGLLFGEHNCLQWGPCCLKSSCCAGQENLLSAACCLLCICLLTPQMRSSPWILQEDLPEKDEASLGTKAKLKPTGHTQSCSPGPETKAEALRSPASPLGSPEPSESLRRWAQSRVLSPKMRAGDPQFWQVLACCQPAS